MNNQRRFTPQAIIDRATIYGIVLIYQNDELVAFVPPDLDRTVRDKALAVITDYREDIVAYLRAQYAANWREIQQSVRLRPLLCFACLDENKETPALPDDYEGLMYCALHHPMGVFVGQGSLWKEKA